MTPHPRRVEKQTLLTKKQSDLKRIRENVSTKDNLTGWVSSKKDVRIAATLNFFSIHR